MASDFKAISQLFYPHGGSVIHIVQGPENSGVVCKSDNNEFYCKTRHAFGQDDKTEEPYFLEWHRSSDDALQALRQYCGILIEPEGV